MIDLGLSWLWAALAGVVSLAAIWLGGRKSAKTAAKLEAAEDTIQAHEVRDEIDRATADDDDPKRKLHDKWSR